MPELGVCSAHRNTPQDFYIMNAKQFSLKIEEIKRNNGDMSYMDAILHYCDENTIDPDDETEITKTEDEVRENNKHEDHFDDEPET